MKGLQTGQQRFTNRLMAALWTQALCCVQQRSVRTDAHEQVLAAQTIFCSCVHSLVEG